MWIGRWVVLMLVMNTAEPTRDRSYGMGNETSCLTPLQGSP